MRMQNLLAACAALLVVIQGVTVSQSETKSTSAVVSASAETLGTKKAAVDAAGSARLMRSDVDPDSKKDDAVQKVDIDVYYETRCPGCLMFLNQTLEPLWRKHHLRDLFSINLYTYGNGMTIPIANVSAGYKFWHPESTGQGWKHVQICQHGNDECLGNLVQVCVKNLTDHEKHMELVFCMTSATMQGSSTEKATYECMEEGGIDKDKVRDCVTSPTGDLLISEAGEITEELKGRLGTPWVMVAGKHVEDDVLMNSTLLLRSVCSHVQNVPVPCSPFNKPDEPAAAEPAAAEAPADPDFVVLPRLQDKEETLYKISKDKV